ncbi:solute carrier family 22 member 6-A-like isoform X2 [Phalacrocorax carbo]|uniref:solute carrier family 22 member 6-A-like isoform X2 n=1 Tax=Phalacrocorax carbo TaxID=9209 RepID=UPI0031196C67
MPFGAVLAQVGGLGRFQVLQTALLVVPILLMASHNLLQNFTAAVPPHRCRVPDVTPGPGATPNVPSATPGPPATTLDGTSTASDGTLRSSNAILRSPDGTLRSSNGTLRSSNGTLRSSGGTLRSPGATLRSPDGTLGSPGATLRSPDGTLRSSYGTLRSPDGNLGSPEGTSIPGATHVTLDGTPAPPDSTHVQPDATLGSFNGTLGPAGATLGWSNATLGSPDATLGSCRRYVASSPANGSTGPRPTEPCHDGWDYDRSIYVATIVTEWDLVCSYRQLRQMAQSIYMAGVLVGALILGGLSDRFGRKAMLIWSYLQLGVMGTCTAFAPNYASYCVFRFAGGMALSGFGLSIACLVVEWIPTPYRAITVAITGFAYTLGQILLAGMAYTVPHWRWLQLTVSLPFFIFFLCSWWLAESARWLVLSGKAERAVKVLQRVAKINKRKEEGEKITVEILKSNMKEELAGLKSSYTISDLVRTPVIRHIFFCLSIVWFSISFSYYGLAMDLQNFGVSIYLIQVIFGAVDFPAKVVVTVSLSYIGRRVSLMVALFLAGLVIIANIFVSTELQTVRTALAVIGKGCLSASFNCVFLYTTELYPTPIRAKRKKTEDPKEKIPLQPQDKAPQKEA